MPSEQKLLAHPLRLEGRVSYYDPLWRLFWLDGPGGAAFLPLSTKPPRLKAGQRVLIEGAIVPGEGLDAERVTVRVLEDFVPVSPLDVSGRINELERLDCRMVQLEGFVDSQQYIDEDHLRLNMVVEERPVIAWVDPENIQNLPNYQGSFIQLSGLYSRRYDPTGNSGVIEIWVSAQRDIRILYAVANAPLFTLPRTSLNEIHNLPNGSKVLVRGEVQSQVIGESVELRDETGQVLARTVLKQRLPIGCTIELVGKVSSFQGDWVLDGCLYRRVESALGEASTGGRSSVYTTIGALRNRPEPSGTSPARVRIAGSVVWSMADKDYFFLQDVTGGVRVHYSRSILPPPSLLKYLQVEGEYRTQSGQPYVELEAYKDLGAMGLPKPRRMSYERAISGHEDGQWIELRGYLKKIESEGDLRRIHVTTPYGAFVCQVLTPVNFTANPGTLIRVQGVCETIVDPQGRIGGLVLHSPFLHDLSIEEDAPEDLFDLPPRRLGSLARLSLESDMLRVRASGTVTRAVPGGMVQIQEDGVGVSLLCLDSAQLSPGDKIEAVGILGAEGYHTVLREVVFRRQGRGVQPEAMLITDPGVLSKSMDGVLVTLEGNLVDYFDRGEVRSFTLQRGNAFFEALLPLSPGSLPSEGLALGSKLSLTGVCRLDYDDSRQLRGLQLLLRDEGDVLVVEAPRFVTLRRALLALGLLAAATLLTALWVLVLRKRVRTQTALLRAQLEQQARMEAGVQHAARLESLGVLAGGIAHDFNNLLTVIMGNLGIAMMSEQAMVEVGEHLLEAQKGAGRAKELTQQLLTFAKGGSPLRSRTALRDLVQECLGACLNSPAVHVEIECSDGLWDVSADRGQLSRAFQNILLNALQAMPEGGNLRVELLNEQVTAGKVPNLEEGDYVKVVVADSGRGIPPDVLPRIFDPYFTTRKEGMGLGLTAVHSIIRKHEGHVEVESEPGRGTRVLLWLQADKEGSVEAVPVHGMPERATPALGKVLLMDDEEAIRKVVTLILSRMGLDVETACDGNEAVELFREARESGRPFDLLIFDLSIPGGMGGKDAMALIRRLDGKVPAIVSSGYSSDPVMADPTSYGFDGTVPKPYEIEELGRVIARVMTEHRR